MSLISRFTRLFRSRNLDSELDDELRSHLEMRVEHNLAAGMSAEDARRDAVLRFGNRALIKEDARGFDVMIFLESFARDVRYGTRSMLRTPAFSLVVLLVLALGISANTIVFSVVSGAVLNPLPYAQPGQLMLVSGRGNSSISYPNFRDLQVQARSLESLALYRGDTANLETPAGAERIGTVMATAELFRVFRVQPMMGRFLTPNDDRLGAAPVLVLSEAAWRSRFQADPNILGRSLLLNGVAYSVIGVAPASFRFFRAPVFVPLGQWSDQRFQSRDGTFGTRALGRLQEGVGPQQLNAELAHIAQGLATQYSDVNAGMRFEAISLEEAAVARIKPMALLFSVGVGLVLLIVCVNVGTLVLARSSFRRREFAVRQALGAGRLRILRQLLTESLVLGLAGGALGVLLARWGMRVALSLLPYSLPPDANVTVDARVLLFAAAVSLISGALFGLLPAAMMSRVDLERTLKSGGRTTARGNDNLQRLMVCAEVAIAVVLLVGTGLLLRSFQRLMRVELGFDPHHVITFSLGLPGDTLSDTARARSSLRRSLEELARVPGVEAVAANLGNLPLTGESDVAMWRTDKPRPATQNDMAGAEWYAVSSDYLQTLSIRLLRGRFFHLSDTTESAPVAVITDSLARKLFPGEEPLGKQLHLEFFNQTVEIVGVVGDIKQFGLADSNVPGIYIPIWQVPDRLVPLLGRFAAIAVKTHAPAASELPGIRRTLQGLDAQQVMYATSTMDDLLALGISQQRASAIVLAAFAAFALLLAGIGIHGVIAYVVGQRTQEIGVRLALGAKPRTVLAMMLRHGLGMVVAGLLIGGAVTPLFVRFVRSMLFGVRAADPMTIAAVVLTVLTAGALAAYLPARRASRVDPVVALRHE